MDVAVGSPALAPGQRGTPARPEADPPRPRSSVFSLFDFKRRAMSGDIGLVREPPSLPEGHTSISSLSLPACAFPPDARRISGSADRPRESDPRGPSSLLPRRPWRRALCPDLAAGTPAARRISLASAPKRARLEAGPSPRALPGGLPVRLDAAPRRARTRSASPASRGRRRAPAPDRTRIPAAGPARAPRGFLLPPGRRILLRPLEGRLPGALASRPPSRFGSQRGAYRSPWTLPPIRPPARPRP